MIEQLCNPAILASLKCFTCFLQQCSFAAGELNVFLAYVTWRQFVKIRRVAVVPTEITLMNRFDVVYKVAVVTAGVAVFKKIFW